MPIRESHYMPAALYPKNIKQEYLSVGGVRELVSDNEIKMHLLCGECEQRFSRRGESEVLNHVAAKIAKKPMPFLERFTVLPVLEGDATMTTYSGTDAQLKMDDFAYFGLSLAWRATHSWIVKGEPDTKPIKLGYFTEPIRAYLTEETTEFPRNIAVLVIACTDKLSRETWFLPTPTHDAWMYEVRFLALGVFFRVCMGRSAAVDLGREACNGYRACIHVGDMSKKTQETLDRMHEPEE